MRKSNAISKILVAMVIVVVIVIAGAAVGVSLLYKSSTSSSNSTALQTTTSSLSASISSSAVAASSSSSTTSSVPSSASSSHSSLQTTNSSTTLGAFSTTNTSSSSSPGTLAIDSARWPYGDFNQVFEFEDTPWPNWAEYDVYQPLVAVNLAAEYNQGIIQFLPALAENWTVSPDARTYTFELRPNITFSNGDPLNAYQVWAQMYSFYYMSGNSSGWLEGYTFFNMSGVNFGPATLGILNQSGGLVSPSQQALAIMENSSWPIYVVNSSSITFRLQNPFQYFLGTLVTEGGLVYDSQWVFEHGGLGTPAAPNSYFNQNPIPGTGPYEFTQIAENNYARFTQNPTYWGKNLSQSEINANPALDPGHVKNVIIYYKPDDLSRYTDLSSGTVQISAIQNADWNLVQQGGSRFQYTILPRESGLVTGLAMNVLLYPTNITSFRQAIAHAINYTQISQQLFFGHLSPWVGPEYPAWSQFYDLGNFSQYQYNLTLAKQYLAESSVSNPTLTYYLEDSCGYCVSRAEIVQSDLVQIGITVNLDVLSSSDWCAQLCGSYSTNVKDPRPMGNLNDIGGSAWAPGTLTPADFWITFVSNTSLTGDGAVYSNPTVQACVNAFTTISNVSQIQSLCKAAQQRIYDDAPYVWFGVLSLWYGGGSEVWQKGVVSGFYLDPVWTGFDTEPIFNTVTFG